MVKSKKARCHMIQYMKDKPTKWGFNVWVIADMSGYTTDFNVYTGKFEQYSDYGLSHNVVIKLLEPFWFQGYEVFALFALLFQQHGVLSHVCFYVFFSPLLSLRTQSFYIDYPCRGFIRSH